MVLMLGQVGKLVGRISGLIPTDEHDIVLQDADGHAANDHGADEHDLWKHEVAHPGEEEEHVEGHVAVDPNSFEDHDAAHEEPVHQDIDFPFMGEDHKPDTHDGEEFVEQGNVHFGADAAADIAAAEQDPAVLDPNAHNIHGGVAPEGESVKDGHGEAGPHGPVHDGSGLSADGAALPDGGLHAIDGAHHDSDSSQHGLDGAHNVPQAPVDPNAAGEQQAADPERAGDAEHDEAIAKIANLGHGPVGIDSGNAAALNHHGDVLGGVGFGHMGETGHTDDETDDKHPEAPGRELDAAERERGVGVVADPPHPGMRNNAKEDATEHCHRTLEAGRLGSTTPLCVTDEFYFDIAADEESLGRIEISVFGNVVPKSVANFRALVTCTGAFSDPARCFKGDSFHRIIHGFVIQGGSKSTGRSIYGPTFREQQSDENHSFLSHSEKGVVAWAEYPIGSQFYILVRDNATYLNKNHVVFGLVTSGMDVVNEIAASPVQREAPQRRIRIVDSGDLHAPLAM